MPAKDPAKLLGGLYSDFLKYKEGHPKAMVAEFATFYDIESAAPAGKVRAFFARPMRSSDKPDCERNHEIVRYPITKGKSLDNLTQKDVSDAFDNVNSLVREGKGVPGCPWPQKNRQKEGQIDPGHLTFLHRRAGPDTTKSGLSR